MNPIGADEVSEVLDRVKHWSLPSRITLARRILESLDPSTDSATGSRSPIDSPTRGVAVELVVGLLATQGEPPNDEEYRRIIEEERWKKYGR